MIYKVANIFGCRYDAKINKYILGVLLAKDGKGKDTRLYFATREEAESIKVGELIEYNDGNEGTESK